MTKKPAYIILFMLALASSAHAITVTSDTDTDLGDIATGSSITLNLTASGYEAEKPSDIVWQLKADEGDNPGLRLDKRRGDSVKLSASSLARTANDGKFSVTASARDNTGTGAVTITGRVVNKPEIITDRLANALAGGERKYVQRLEFNPGIEPVELEMTGNVPEGLVFGEIDEKGIKHHAITGNIERPGTYIFMLTASNNVGSASRELTLQADPVAPGIKVPKDFPRDYLVYAGKPFYIDINTLQFTGSSPREIDIDGRSKELGLEYDSAKRMITGTIPEGTKAKKHRIILHASNQYGKTAKTSFGLNINSTAVGFRLSPANNSIQRITEEDADIYAVPVLLGKPFRTQFKADIATKPITWDYEITGMDDSINGKKIIADLGGKFGGLVFSPDGSITGTPKKRGNVSFVAEASNPAGVSRSDVYDFVFGSAPQFDAGKTSVPVKLANGRSTNISLADYLVPVSNGRITDTFTASGAFPPGMSCDGKSIKGIPMALAREHFTRYTINIAASNAFGTSHSRIILDLQDVPQEEPEEEPEQNEQEEQEEPAEDAEDAEYEEDEEISE